MFVNGSGRGGIAGLAHRRALDRQSARVVDQAIEDGVCESRFVDDVDQIPTLRRGRTFRPPVVENEQFRFDKLSALLQNSDV